jgi:hypothetical protein
VHPEPDPHPQSPEPAPQSPRVCFRSGRLKRRAKKMAKRAAEMVEGLEIGLLPSHPNLRSPQSAELLLNLSPLGEEIKNSSRACTQSLIRIHRALSLPPLCYFLAVPSAELLLNLSPLGEEMKNSSRACTQSLIRIHRALSLPPQSPTNNIVYIRCILYY